MVRDVVLRRIHWLQLSYSWGLARAVRPMVGLVSPSTALHVFFMCTCECVLSMQVGLSCLRKGVKTCGLSARETKEKLYDAFCEVWVSGPVNERLFVLVQWSNTYEFVYLVLIMFDSNDWAWPVYLSLMTTDVLVAAGGVVHCSYDTWTKV